MTIISSQASKVLTHKNLGQHLEKNAEEAVKIMALSAQNDSGQSGAEEQTMVKKNALTAEVKSKVLQVPVCLSVSKYSIVFQGLLIGHRKFKALQLVLFGSVFNCFSLTRFCIDKKLFEFRLRTNTVKDSPQVLTEDTLLAVEFVFSNVQSSTQENWFVFCHKIVLGHII